MTNGDRVRTARELRRLTQTLLSNRLGVTQAALAQIENGFKSPSDELLERIALHTGFPPSFFRLPSLQDFPEGTLFFRAHASISARDRAEAYQWARVVYFCRQRLAERLELPRSRLEKVGADPELAARLTRSDLGLGPYEPIPNVVSALERAGVVVTALPLALEKRDAFSLWAGAGSVEPVLVLTGYRSGDRLRYTASHELGHLVRDSIVGAEAREPRVLEQEANLFAAEFLCPKEGIEPELAAPLNLQRLSQLKLRWGVSMQMLVVRAKELGTITERQARYLFEQISWRGWRTKEPGEVPLEKPRALRQMAEMLYPSNSAVGVNYARMAQDLCLSPQLTLEILSAHAGKRPSLPTAAPAAKVVPLKRRPAEASY